MIDSLIYAEQALLHNKTWQRSSCKASILSILEFASSFAHTIPDVRVFGMMCLHGWRSDLIFDFCKCIGFCVTCLGVYVLHEGSDGFIYKAEVRCHSIQPR